MKKIVIILYILFHVQLLFAQLDNNSIPYSTNSTNITIWNGSEYIPFFLKGVNLGVSVPGTFPGELAATKSQYARWFQEIKDAGFNNIRLYTLHYPIFYEVLDSFNLANPQNPLLFFQGIWLNEDIPGYANDLYYLSSTFKTEITEDVASVHGNTTIDARFGKAFGTYTHDVSKWCIGYIIGREIYPNEILTTNQNHLNPNAFIGNHFSIFNASASEIWITSMLDFLVDYEKNNYQTERPVSASSWPTLDPITHSEELNLDEDKASVDLSKVGIINAPAGFFISYHAYPYYPDFVSNQTNYLTYSDTYGSNSYIGYLTDLKSHYPNYPLIIAEYGVPSSWGIAHYASSGMNHGGFDEQNQGETNIRMLQTIESANCGGGIQFSWIDEWFKRTWITDYIDYNPDSRVRWQNITAAEQNFGLKSFAKDSNIQTIKDFGTLENITRLKGEANYEFLELEIDLKNPLDNPDNIWIAFDTYGDTLGDSKLPNGDTIPFRSEFALQITNYSASLYVTEAYDLFGKFHNISTSNQLYHSTKTDGAPWFVVRWKNNSSQENVQYIGNLQVNHDFQLSSTKDAITIYNDKITVRIPWSLLQFVDPSSRLILNDNKNTTTPEDTITEGINIAIQYKNQWFNTDNRFTWNTWNSIDKSTLKENFKTSYWVMQERLPEFNSNAIAVKDSFNFFDNNFPITIPTENGLLQNDFDIDGNYMVSIITQNPQNGNIYLNNDGSFTYSPNTNFNGVDSISYCIFDGNSLSTPNKAYFNIQGNTGINQNEFVNTNEITTYPNPCKGSFTLKTTIEINDLMLYNDAGLLVLIIPNKPLTQILNISMLEAGNYYLLAKSHDTIISQKIIILP